MFKLEIHVLNEYNVLEGIGNLRIVERDIGAKLEKEKTIIYKCGECGEEVTLVLPQIINEEKTAEVEDMSLFKWTCTSCKHVWKLLYPCMYVNEDKKILVWFVNNLSQSDQLEAQLEEEFRERTKGFTKRFCNTLEEFSEKVRVLESGLDDRTIELLKIMTFARLHVSMPSLESIYYYRRDELGNYEFTIFSEEGPNGIALPFTMYQEIAQIVQNEIPELKDQFYRIDLDWAGKQIVGFQK